MDKKAVNFLQPGKVVSIRFVGGICVATVDFGAEVPVVLHPYHDEQLGDYIVMNGNGRFIKQAPPAPNISP
jgi:hypothetical protein